MTSEVVANSRPPRLLLGLVAAMVLGGAPTARAQATAPVDVLKIGDVVAPFDAEGIDGSLKHVLFPKGPATVLLFFLSGCPACHHMIPEWNDAFGRKPKGLQIVGVLLDKEPPGFFMATPISFPVVRAPGGDFKVRYKIQRVPMSLRVAAGGRVEDVAVGPIDPIRLGEIFRP